MLPSTVHCMRHRPHLHFTNVQKQEFQLGTTIRNLYFDPSSPSFIQGIANSSALFQQSQVQVRADAGGEGGVIFDSAIALTQGLWPPTPLQSTVLANGTNVTSPLSGYQYIPSKLSWCLGLVNRLTDRGN